MRKVFTYIIMLCCMMFCTVAAAAQVTNVKWGVDNTNVVRIVVDADAPVTYAVENAANMLTLTVNAPLKDNKNESMKVRSTLAPMMQVIPAGDKTVVKLSLTKPVAENEYKSFTLKQDPKTNRPYRVVVDVMADKKAPGTVKIPVSKPVADRTVVSNRPVVVSNKPVTSAASVSTPPVKAEPPKAEIKQEDKKEEKKEVKKEVKKDKKSDEKKSSKNGFATSGGLKGKIITIDAGHGGSDPGAVGAGGTKEKDITLSVAKKVEELLKKRGAKVYMTRTEDKDVHSPYAADAAELQARVDVAEKRDSDLFISIHINSSSNKKVGGFSSYYYPKTQHDLRIAKAIQDQLTSNFGVDDLGVREANFYVIKRCSMPATLLELCFISNPKEEKLMNSKWFQNKTAKLIAEGIEEYFE